MCGIIGYTGTLDAKKVIIDGLKELEYRGYDSAGIALMRKDQSEDPIYIMKEAGPVSVLEESTKGDEVASTCGIGHTRWATHGGVTDQNAHPHTTGRVTLIHNGIIENYRELINSYNLEDSLISETDSEVALRIIDYYYNKYQDPYRAIKKSVGIIRGSYSFCILFSNIPGKIFCIRNVSPLVAGVSEKGSLIASDLTALLPYTRDYFVLPEHTIAVLDPDGITLQDLEGNEVQPEMLHAQYLKAQASGRPSGLFRGRNSRQPVPGLQGGLHYRLRNSKLCRYGRKEHHGADPPDPCFRAYRIGVPL